MFYNLSSFMVLILLQSIILNLGFIKSNSIVFMSKLHHALEAESYICTSVDLEIDTLWLLVQKELTLKSRRALFQQFKSVQLRVYNFMAIRN